MGIQLNKKPKQFQDMGLGTRANARGQRMVNRDGTFNVVRHGVKWYHARGLYHWMITMTWPQFFILVVSSYIIINLFFACLYLLTGLHGIEGYRSESNIGKFWEAFFLSAQTFTTLGYGRLNPVGLGANIVSAWESMTGLLAFAIATSVMYGRFSRPGARLLYSCNILLAPYMGGTGLMFRMANRRVNQLIEIEVSLTFSIIIVNSDGIRKREYFALDLERNKINFFPTAWTVVHPMTENSPVFGLSKQDLEAGEAEFLVLVKAFDDTFSQTVYSRTSYRAEEVVCNAKFLNIYGQTEDGIPTIDLHRIDEFERIFEG